MKPGDRVAIRLNQMRDMFPYYGTPINPIIRARGTIREVRGDYFWITWDAGVGLQSGGWMQGRFIPADKAHMEELQRIAAASDDRPKGSVHTVPSQAGLSGRRITKEKAMEVGDRVAVRISWLRRMGDNYRNYVGRRGKIIHVGRDVVEVEWEGMSLCGPWTPCYLILDKEAHLEEL